MDQSPGLGLLTTDRELVVRSWNSWLVEATGLAEAQAQGRPLLELLPGDRRDAYGDVLADVLETGASRVLAPAFHHYLLACPTRTPSAHFDQMQQRVTIAPLRADGTVAGLMVTIEDVTERMDEERSRLARLADSAAVEDALAQVGASDWRLRGAAVRTLRQSASREEIAHLLESVRREHHDLNLLSSALQVLISAGRDVVAPLVTLLSDPNANLRMHAALALGQLQAADATPALIAALDDADANVRFHAIEAIGRAPVPEAVEPLARIAASGDFFLAFPAVDALSRTDDARVGPSLLSLLSDDLLRPAVVDALAALGDEECVAPLVDLLNTGAGEPGPVAAALAQIRHRYDEPYGAGDHIVSLARSAIAPAGVDRLIAAVRERQPPTGPLVSVLGWMGAAGVEAVAALVGEPGLEAETTEAVLRAGRAAVKPLLAIAADGDRAARIAAVDLLGRLADRESVPVLAGLLDGADAELVAAAAGALATVGDHRALDRLLPLFGHEHTAVRQAAIAAVNSLGAESTAARVRERLRDPDPRVRECAVRVGGYFGFDACLTGIIEALDAREEEVRRAAIEQLPMMSERRALERLATAIGDETPRNRAAAAHAARTVDEPILDGPLLKALGDEDAWVRYFAAKSLGQRGGSPAGAADALAALALGDAAPHVRIASIEALGMMDADAAFPVAAQLMAQGDPDLAGAALSAIAAFPGTHADDLIEQAVRSTNSALRACAIQALGARRTPRAVDALAWAARVTDHPDQAARAVEGLGAIAVAAGGDARAAAVGALVNLGADQARRGAAAAALGRVPADGVAEIAQALTAPWPGMRLTAVEGLARMRHPRASAALAAALADPDPAIRAAAVFAFGRLGTLAVAPTIVALRDRDPDLAVRRRAAAVCQRHGWGR
jgi:HEAT repeat protein